MTDIFSEVEEDLRREKAKRLWRRFGPYVLMLAVLIVLGTAAWRGYLYWREQQAAATGDRYIAALQLIEDGKRDEALKALADLVKDGSGGYPVLARFRLAAELVAAGKMDEAAKAFDAIAADASTPPLFRSMASLRAAMLLVDTASFAEMKTRLDPLAAVGGPWRTSARELLGLSAYKAGDLEAARTTLEAIVSDQAASQAAKARANLMLELIRARIGDAPPAAKS